MAFTFAHVTDPYEHVGGLKRVTGTFLNTAGSTGGEIVTGLSRILFAKAQHTGSAVVASAPVFNETFALDSGALTLITVADADGIWEAWGY